MAVKAQPSPVTITSTTDSKEAVELAHGNPMEKKPEPKKAFFKQVPAAEEKPAEKASESGPEEPEEIEAAAPSDVDGDADDEPREEEERPKKKSGVQKRIDKLSKARSEAERERDYWREQATKSAAQAPAEKIDETRKASANEPKADDFEKHEDYVKALAKWEVTQEMKTERQKQKEAEVKSEREKIHQDHFKRVNEFKKSHEDFEEVLSDLAEMKVSSTIENAILESDNGPELLYELAKNPEEFERINSLPPDKAARALGRFEASIEKPSEEPKKKTTKAPAPMKPIGSKAGHQKSIADDMPYDEWRNLRDSQIKSRGGSTLR